MTKPTGRPRGRPKTKEYVTLMARVDLTLADEVKRYASLHRQPISVVIRDALTLLMEEYPCAGDRSGPHQLAAHEFLSDRYESRLDMLLGESDSAELEDLLSDTNRAVVEAMLSDTSGRDAYASDTKEAMTARPSDDNTDRAAVPPRTPARARSQKASDTKADAPLLCLTRKKLPLRVYQSHKHPLSCLTAIHQRMTPASITWGSCAHATTIPRHRTEFAAQNQSPLSGV